MRGCVQRTRCHGRRTPTRCAPCSSRHEPHPLHQMLRKFKVLRPEMPVILLTSWGTIPLAVEGLKHGAVDFMTKPWSNRDLIAKIKKAIDAADRQSAQSNELDTLDDMEREAIVKALRICDGNMSTAAQKLGITRQALYRRIEKYGL